MTCYRNKAGTEFICGDLPVALDEDMTDRQKNIEKLAKFVGKLITPKKKYGVGTLCCNAGFTMEFRKGIVGSIIICKKCGKETETKRMESALPVMKTKNWNPYENWNHCRQIEERLLEDGKGKLCKKYLAFWDSKAQYISSNLDERMIALLSVLPNE